MDRPIPETQIRRRGWGRAGRWLLLVLAAVALFVVFRQWLRPTAKRADFRMASVEIGDMANTITASGEVVPAFEQQINAPVSTEIKRLLRRSGDALRQGELIMELDGESVRLEYEAAQDQLALQRNRLVQLGLEHARDVEDLDYDSQIKALEVESLEAALADTKRLKAAGGATQEEVERAELRLKIARLEKKKLDNALRFRQNVLESQRRGLELAWQIEEKKAQELGRKLTQTSVTAPRNGVITWLNEAIGQKVAAGETLVRLADLGSFRVEASCSDRYANQVRVGMPVEVRANKQPLRGQISAILPAVENNTIRFVVALAEADNPALRPNMRVDVFIVTARREGVLRVQNGAAFTGAREQDVFVVQGQRAERRRVQVGMANSDYVELLGEALRPGDRLIISDTKDYIHLKEITLQQ